MTDFIVSLEEGAVHPSAKIININIVSGYVDFQWVDEKGNPIDSGISTARIDEIEEIIDADFLSKALSSIAADEE